MDAACVIPLSLQARTVDHGGQARLSMAAGLDHGHAQLAASPRRPAFPGSQGDHRHSGQLPAALSGGPREGKIIYSQAC